MHAYDEEPINFWMFSIININSERARGNQYSASWRCRRLPLRDNNCRKGYIIHIYIYNMNIKNRRRSPNKFRLDRAATAVFGRLRGGLRTNTYARGRILHIPRYECATARGIRYAVYAPEGRSPQRVLQISAESRARSTACAE